MFRTIGKNSSIIRFFEISLIMIFYVENKTVLQNIQKCIASLTTGFYITQELTEKNIRLSAKINYRIKTLLRS